MEGTNPTSLIPVPRIKSEDVTGIQCDQVFGRERVLHGADAPWLDSCDILGLDPGNRNEGVARACTSPMAREV